MEVVDLVHVIPSSENEPEGGQPHLKKFFSHSKLEGKNATCA